MPFRLDALKANPEAIRHLRALDLYPDVENYPEALFTVDGARSCVRFARDLSGGQFTQLAGSGHILYASSEGEGGVMAADFDALIRLVVAHPYRFDILGYSGGGVSARCAVPRRHSRNTTPATTMWTRRGRSSPLNSR
jgi:hypothetical protein